MSIVKVRLNKSLIGRKSSHIKTAYSMGLRKIGDIAELAENDANKGKINSINYLLLIL